MQKVVRDMKLTEILRDIIKEELVGDDLYFYHVTSKSAISSIIKNGLRPAERTMEGKGVYGFIDADRAMGYARKDAKDNEIAIATFRINGFYTKRLLYFDLDLAKQVFGSENYHLKNQLERYFKTSDKGGIENLVDRYNYYYGANKSVESYIQELDELEKKDRRYISREMLFGILDNENNSLNVVYEGEYGMQIRLNSLHYIDKMISYKVITNWYAKETSTHYPSILDDIPETEEFEPLRNFFNDNPTYLDQKPEYTIKKLKDLQFAVRSNKDYEYYDQLINLLDKVK